MTRAEHINNWGLYPTQEARVLSPRYLEEAVQLIKDSQELIPRGNGRCYGDSSLHSTILSALRLNRILAFDQEAGIMHCEAGVLLDDILTCIVPKGFFLPVSPGTKFISIGGALASDIHGKNHHVDGVFSDHVLSFTLIDAQGTIREVFPGEDLFYQTAGGMGLTGFIYSVKFSLKPIESAFMRVVQYKAKNLEEIFTLFENNTDSTYSVAWIDCLASGASLGRSILLLGEHAKAAEISNKEPLQIHKKPRLSIPFHFPSWALNGFSVKAFNTLFYHKPSSRHGSTRVQHYEPYFYPLDAIHHWNRMYGKKGFTQYQCVLPREVSYEGISSLLKIMQEYRQGSFLAVLKLFGKSHHDRYLHFPMEGYTLAVDFQISPKVFEMLDRFDEVVTTLGGKVYLTKDVRMQSETFSAMYPKGIIRAEGFNSLQAQRLQL